MVFVASTPSSSATMVLYEVVLTVDAQADGQRLLDFLKRAARHVLTRSGNVRKIENWGVRPLAYRVRKNQHNHESARFVSMWIDAHPVVLNEVEDLARYNRDVLRHNSFRRKFTLPKNDGFLESEVRKAIERSEEAR